ncbi:MAG: hypothetical protein D3904_15300, partial [Candidatus Electrothrix sp. EH2]|nr:hypothetical protein [Candidatus Electrothrix sp. EH2]
KEYRELITRLADKRLIVTGRDEERGEETVEVVHEALIRRWQTLRQWVDEEREFLVWQEKLRVLLGQWEESGKDEGALLRGLPLDEALRWRETHVVHLTGEELEFIEASESARKKLRRKKGIAAAFGMLVAATVMLTFFVLWKDAEQQKAVAEQERQHAVEQKGIAEQKTVEAEKETNRAEQQTLTANYNLAKVFEEKAMISLRTAEEQGDIEAYKQVILYTSAALIQKIGDRKCALEPYVRSTVIAHGKHIFEISLGELWSQSCGPSIAISPDSRTLACSPGKNVQLFDITTGKRIKTLPSGHVAEDTTFSFDGKQLVFASANTVRIWDIKNNRESHVLIGHSDRVRNVAFSPDGNQIASASYDKTIRFWDSKTGKEVKVLQGHTAPVETIAFSANGKRLASSSYDNTVRIWDTDGGNEIKSMPGHFVAFSPDGKSFATAFKDKIRNYSA